MSGPSDKRLKRASIVRLLGFVAILAGGLIVFAAYAAYEAEARLQHASESVSVEAGARSARLREWLLRVDRTLNWFRAEDLSTTDRVAVTARMLRTERFMAPARSLFLVSATGRLVAGTLPLPDGSTNLSGHQWFKALQGRALQPGLQLTGCTRDPFGAEDGVVVYRTVLDRDAVAGYVGTFLPQSAIADVLRDDDPSNGTVGLALRTAAGEVFGCKTTVAAALPEPRAGGLRVWLAGMVHASPTLNKRSALVQDRLIEPGGLHLITTADALNTMSDEDWAAVLVRASYVSVSLLLIMALLSTMLRRLGRPSRPALLPITGNAVEDGADWMWELNSAGNLVGLAGNAPEHLLPPSGRTLAEIAGPIGSQDMRWDRLNTAISAGHAFEGLQVPFQIPGRSGLLTIFAFSGQPVLASGGFWGTASLVSEESIARSIQPARAEQLSVA